MSAVYDYLEECKNALETIPELESVKIGLERGVGSKDAPFARIVVMYLTPEGMTGAMLYYQIVFGFDSKNRDYEELHDKYFAMEESIKQALESRGAAWVETVTDEDSVVNLKTAVVQFTKGLC